MRIYRYEVEFAVSGRSGCRGCGKDIPKGTIRFGLVVPASEGYFKNTHYYCPDCFWTYPPATGQLEGLDHLMGLHHLPMQQQQEIQQAYCRLRDVNPEDCPLPQPRMSRRRRCASTQVDPDAEEQKTTLDDDKSKQQPKKENKKKRQKTATGSSSAKATKTKKASASKRQRNSSA